MHHFIRRGYLTVQAEMPTGYHDHIRWRIEINAATALGKAGPATEAVGALTDHLLMTRWWPITNVKSPY